MHATPAATSARSHERTASPAADKAVSAANSAKQPIAQEDRDSNLASNAPTLLSDQLPGTSLEVQADLGGGVIDTIA